MPSPARCGSLTPPSLLWYPFNTLYFVLKDHLGSASVVTDASGTIVGETRFYPFGETRFTTGMMYTDKLFTGQREITGAGIYHYGARFYSPKLGRFLSADTIVPGYANPQNLNRYSYVTNNPLRYTDPTGHMRVQDGPQQDRFKPSVADKYRPRPRRSGHGGSTTNSNGGLISSVITYAGDLITAGVGLSELSYRPSGNNLIIYGSRLARGAAGYNPYTNIIGSGNQANLFSISRSFRSGYSSNWTGLGIGLSVLSDIAGYANGTYSSSEAIAAITVDVVTNVGFAAVAGAAAGFIAGTVTGAVGGTVTVPGLGTISGGAVGAIAGAVAGFATGVTLSYGFNNLEISNGQTLRDAAIDAISDGIDNFGN